MTRRSPFKDCKTSRAIIRLAVMLCVRFPLSLRNVEDLARTSAGVRRQVLPERAGVFVTEALVRFLVQLRRQGRAFAGGGNKFVFLNVSFCTRGAAM